MGFFSFIQEIAMDLGTANTIIISDDKIVVDEPSVVALDRRTDKMIAVGEKAKMMYEKTHDNIRTIRPLRDGVIADFTACEQMMRGLIKMVHTGSRLFSPSLRMVIGVPSGSTEVELRAVRDSAEHADGRDVYLIFEPMAAAIGIGIDVEAPEGNMIVDIGGGSTEIAVISLGGIVSNNSIRIAGDDLTADIQEYMSRQHNVKVSERMAERIKIHVGSALTDLGDEAPEDYIVHDQIVSPPCRWKSPSATRKSHTAWTRRWPRSRMQCSLLWSPLHRSSMPTSSRMASISQAAVLCCAVLTSVCKTRSTFHSILPTTHSTVWPKVQVLP